MKKPKKLSLLVAITSVIVYAVIYSITGHLSQKMIFLPNGLMPELSISWQLPLYFIIILLATDAFIQLAEMINYRLHEVLQNTGIDYFIFYLLMAALMAVISILSPIFWDLPTALNIIAASYLLILFFAFLGIFERYGAGDASTSIYWLPQASFYLGIFNSLIIASVIGIIYNPLAGLEILVVFIAGLIVIFGSSKIIVGCFK